MAAIDTQIHGRAWSCRTKAQIPWRSTSTTARIGEVPMNILVLNSGSSSLKFQLIATDPGRIAQNNDEPLCRGQIERIGGEAIITVHTRKGFRQKFTASISDIFRSLEYMVRWIASDESG